MRSQVMQRISSIGCGLFRVVAPLEPKNLSFGEDRISDSALACDMLITRSAGGVQNDHRGESDHSSLEFYDISLFSIKKQ